jgi:putative ABC transport system permease protein
MDSLIISNITHRPARTLVSVMGVAIGVFLIEFTVGLAHGVLREHGKSEASMGAEIMLRASGTQGFAGGDPFLLPVSRAEEIARIDGVRAAVPIGQNNVPSNSGFGLRLVDGIPFDEYAAIAGLKITEGRKLTDGDEAIVDEGWRKEHKASVGSTTRIYDRPFTIVGIFEPPGGAGTKIPLTTMQDQLGGESRCTAVLVACINPAQQESVAARIHRRFPDDQIIFTRDFPELYAAGAPALNVFIEIVVSVAIAISMLVILLAMYTTVTERTREIGILKSLGMSKTEIAWIIEQEAIVIGLLGVILGILLTLAARVAVMRMSLLNIEIEPGWILVALVMGLMAGTLGALYPALRAARQDAVEALNYE